MEVKGQKKLKIKIYEGDILLLEEWNPEIKKYTYSAKRIGETD